jgi:hypothetical protein
MSNEPQSPNTDPEPIGNKMPMRDIEGTEMDLWDLDSHEPEYAIPAERQLDTIKEEEIKSPEKTVSDPEPPGDEARVEENIKPEPKALLPGITSLSMVEKVAMSFLFAALALGATLAIIHFTNQVPTQPLIAEKIDYPIQGKLVEIKAASTYWRAPVTTGENADIVRRGTKLIPVLKLNLSSKSSAIRVFFRNEDGLVIGDGITRNVSGETEVSIAATAGFDDVGMHTAYRTGDSRPWVVQVFEGPDEAAPREEFSMILETEISTTLR